MTAEEYTKEVEHRADKVIADLKELANLMRGKGDESRALDIDEAIIYVEGALS